ncbi:MAG: NAD(P)/FAD-dependent oxidoreductase [Proteobacteria bacterium]|nr:NAD(P)/FAD-dependent oxidoreductase [Pseudomonadota bacterium]
METYDLIIAGAGPAGLALASELAASHLKILLLDKKRDAEDVRYHSSGSFINPVDWNLPPSVLHPVSTICFSSKNRTAVKRGRFYTINRKQLLRHLENRARENPHFTVLYSSPVRQVHLNSSGITDITYKKNDAEIPVTAKVFVDCSGNGAVFSRKAGLLQAKPAVAVGAEYIVPLKKGADESDLFVGSNFEGGYGWIFPLDADNAIIGYGTLYKNGYKTVEDNLKKMWEIKRVAERCELKPLQRQIAVLKTGIPLTALTKRNLVTVGDVALQANPLAGEGIRFVMDGARIAARYIPAAIGKDDTRVLENYSRQWQRKYRRKHKIAYMLQQKIKNHSSDDAALDFGVKELSKLSDADFAKVLSGDLGYLFLLKMFLKTRFRS